MFNPRLILWILLFASVFGKISCYRIFYAEDECWRNGTVLIRLGSGSVNSTGILKASRNGRQLPDMHCHIALKSSSSNEIVISIRFIDLMPPDSCHNYLELNSSSDIRVRLCGYFYDKTEIQSYLGFGEVDLIFHTQSANSSQTTQFEIVFTSVNSAWLSKCRKEESLCENGRCIWKGLVNDGHNNCGDFSDEPLTFDDSEEHQLSAGLTLAIIIPIIVLSLGLILILVCCFGNRVTAKIERLIQNEARRNETRSALVNSNSTARRQNYNTGSGQRNTERRSPGITPPRRSIFTAETYEVEHEQRPTRSVPQLSVFNFPAGFVTNIDKEEQLPSYEAPPSYDSVTTQTKEKF